MMSRSCNSLQISYVWILFLGHIFKNLDLPSEHLNQLWRNNFIQRNLLYCDGLTVIVLLVTLVNCTENAAP